MASVLEELQDLAKDSEALSDLILDVFTEKACVLNNSSVGERVEFLINEGVFKDENEAIAYIKKYEPR